MEDCPPTHDSDTLILPSHDDKESRESTPSFEFQSKVITALAYAPDSRYLLSRCADGTLTLWYTSEDNPPVCSRTEVSDYRARVTAMALYSTEAPKAFQIAWASNFGSLVKLRLGSRGSKLIGGADDGTLMVWDLAEAWHYMRSTKEEEARTGQRLGNLRRPEHERSPEYPPRRHGIPAHQKSITLIVFSPNSDLLASCGADGYCRIWKVPQLSEPHECKPISTLECKDSFSISAAVFSPDGKSIATTLGNNACHIWDIVTGAKKGFIAPAPSKLGMSIRDPVTGVSKDVVASPPLCFSPDGRYIARASEDGKVHVYQLQSVIAQPDAALTGHNDTVNAVTYSTDGRYIVSGSLDGAVRVWDAHQGWACVHVFEGYYGECLLISPDGKKLVYGSRDGQLQSHAMPATDADDPMDITA